MEQKTYLTPEASSLQMPTLLQLEAAAMKLKLQQNKQALQDQGIQSASDKLRQMMQPQPPQQ